MKKVSIAVQKKNLHRVDAFDIDVLQPLEEDRDKLNAYHENQILHVTVVGTVDPRSREQLALYWVCIGKVLANTENFRTREGVSEYVKKKCHYVEWFHGIDGKQTFRTKSISYKNMEQPDFNLFMDKAIPVMAEMLGCTEEQLVNSQFDIE